jgi:hypothetical protein
MNNCSKDHFKYVDTEKDKINYISGKTNFM